MARAERKNLQYRQGDVFLDRVKDAEVGAELPREGGAVVLAFGEATGHAHAIREDGAVLYDGKPANGDRFLRVLRPVNLTHEEHAAILLDPGLYRVRRQRQWSDAEEPVRVAD
jgi:hypothetical protein